MDSQIVDFFATRARALGVVVAASELRMIGGDKFRVEPNLGNFAVALLAGESGWFTGEARSTRFELNLTQMRGRPFRGLG